MLQEGPFDLKTGLHPLEDAEDLYEIDEHYVEEMEERRQLLDRMHTEVFASTSEVRSIAHACCPLEFGFLMYVCCSVS